MIKKILFIIAKMMVVLPDSVFLSLIYRLKTGRVLHLKNPQRMSEKIQHYKAYYRDEKMLPCTDKYLVRDVVRQRLRLIDI